jgi:hypothetical protein
MRTATVLLLTATFLLAACGDIFSRVDFTAMVMDKSEQEVTSKAGRPAEIDTSNPDRVVWTYKMATFDMGNGNQRDPVTRVVFQRSGPGGALKVTGVEF